jgi:hypothetical protein
MISITPRLTELTVCIDLSLLHCLQQELEDHPTPDRGGDRHHLVRLCSSLPGGVYLCCERHGARHRRVDYIWHHPRRRSNHKPERYVLPSVPVTADEPFGTLSVLICRRLWKFAKFNAVAYANPSSPRLQTPLFAAMVILVESGVLLSAGAIAMLGATLANNLSIYPISDAVRILPLSCNPVLTIRCQMTPLLGIGFNLIVIRVNAQRQETLGSGPEPEGVGAYPLQFRPSRSPLESQSQGVHVSVTRDVNFDSEALRVGGAHKPGDSGKWKP